MRDKRKKRSWKKHINERGEREARQKENKTKHNKNGKEKELKKGPRKHKE